MGLGRGPGVCISNTDVTPCADGEPGGFVTLEGALEYTVSQVSLLAGPEVCLGVTWWMKMESITNTRALPLGEPGLASPVTDSGEPFTAK